jgi:hypothetical protein
MHHHNDESNHHQNGTGSNSPGNEPTTTTTCQITTKTVAASRGFWDTSSGRFRIGKEAEPKIELSSTTQTETNLPFITVNLELLLTCFRVPEPFF